MNPEESSHQIAERPAPEPPLFKRLGALVAGFLLIFVKFGKALLLWLKVVLPGLQLAKFGFIFSKLLTTGGTMLISVWYYAQLWGWKFALGFVVSILIHELGHVYFAYKKGVPVTAPVFIPGMGAMILHKGSSHSIWDDAMIGIGGPLWGASAGVFYLIAAYYFHSPMMQALAYTTFLMNLFNLIPVMPLDGGWITRAVSPRIWVLGVLGIGYLILSGRIRNPLVFVLLIMALPQIWRGLRHGTADHGQDLVTREQRWKMGLAYVCLCGVLAWLMGEAHLPI